MKISIIIPAYNEEKRIADVLRAYKSMGEIIVVADGKDKTAEIAKANGARVLEFKHRLGKGGGVIEGMKVAKGDYIGFVDSDGSITPNEFKKLVDAMHECDIAIGSRRAKGSKVCAKQSFNRRFMSNIFNIYINALFFLRISDTQCGAKLFKRECIKRVLPRMKSRGFEFDVELLWRLKKQGCRIAEVPVKWAHEEGSTFSLSNGPQMLLSLLRIRLGL
jgi:glycosyltransferase involved in cell wall biosynthesis